MTKKIPFQGFFVFFFNGKGLHRKQLGFPYSIHFRQKFYFSQILKVSETLALQN